jgi:hypothetical protein
MGHSQFPECRNNREEENEEGGSRRMSAPPRSRSAIKFIFWTIVSAGFFLWVAHLHVSGRLAEWYYYSAADGGYAVNANEFYNATKENPAILEIGSYARIDGLQAVPVKKGDRLPLEANGIISDEQLESGKRASLQGNQIIVTVPWEIKESKGFKYKDTFKHKGIRTYPWAAPVNVVIVIGLGIALGYMAEGLTDLLGVKLEKIRHFEGH